MNLAAEAGIDPRRRNGKGKVMVEELAREFEELKSKIHDIRSFL
jgi:hypothetical protein